MKLKYEENTLTFSFTEDLFIEFHTDWSQFWGKYNWHTFHILELYVENDKFTGGLECEVWVLGFGLRLRWNYDPSVLAKYDEEVKNL